MTPQEVLDAAFPEPGKADGPQSEYRSWAHWSRMAGPNYRNRIAQQATLARRNR